MNTVSLNQDLPKHILSVAQKIIGAKGYSAVGLTEILTTANVPKGSFYHYFKSKDAFGEAMLNQYFEDYLGELDDILNSPDKSMAECLISYWEHWKETQESFNCQGKCLAVKLAAEVVDLSEAMRLALQAGTAGIIDRLQNAIAMGIADGSLKIEDDANKLAHTLYQLWLGASLMAKITRTKKPLDNAMSATKTLLNLN
jgi:TetR/AcrR family transcriptional repressor of nem operon